MIVAVCSDDRENVYFGLELTRLRPSAVVVQGCAADIAGTSDWRAAMPVRRRR